jgi:hypothetical protein
MLKKIFILIIFAMAAAFVADYYGIIDIPSYEGKPKIFETRDDLLYKSQKKMDSDLK